MKIDGVVNFADIVKKQEFLAKCGALQEPHEIEMHPYKPRRSNAANRYWFGVCVKAFCAYQREQGQMWSAERAHAFIVGEVLGKVDVTNPKTGEVFSVRKETHEMNSDAFSEFVELGHAWLAEWGIVVQSKSEFEQMERDSKPRKEQLCHR